MTPRQQVIDALNHRQIFPIPYHVDFTGQEYSCGGVHRKAQLYGYLRTLHVPYLLQWPYQGDPGPSRFF